MTKSKEEILDAGIEKMIADNPNDKYLSLPDIKGSNEYKMQLAAMDEYAKQQAIAYSHFIDGGSYECTLHTDDGVKIWESQTSNSKPIDDEQLYTKYLESKK